MYRHVFVGLLLVGFQLPCYNCVPGPVFSLQGLPMDLSLEDKHTVDNLNFLEDAKVEMAKRVAECKDERDCSWIETELAKYSDTTLEEYCELYKDKASIKQCRKTCKLCNAPAPIECKDERDCSWIETELAKNSDTTLEEYCELYKDKASIKQCRKTCKLCNAPAPIECKDERDCSWIETELAKYEGNLEEYCELYKDTAPIKQCRKTCKMCKAPAPSVCQDERQDCDRLIEKTGGGVKLQEYCNKWKDDPAVKQCPETCNVCPSIPSRDLGVATAVANKRLAQAARDSRANLLYNVKKFLAARRGYHQAFPKKRAFSGIPLMEP